jgi:hypothetical protein
LQGHGTESQRVGRFPNVRDGRRRSWDGPRRKSIRGTVETEKLSVGQFPNVQPTYSQRYVKRFTTVSCVLHVLPALSSISTRSMLSIASIVSRQETPRNAKATTSR